jgi:DNA-directed RNA polymerase specialized sigma24 family protein
MFLEHGASYRQIACVAGMSERSVARRIRRIVVRLRNWSYVVLAMQKGLAAFDIAAARLHFVGGLSQREVAIRLGCGRPAVSMALARVRAATGLKTRTRAGIGTGSAGGQEESSREMCA